jgi:hypothetical protein
MDLPYYREFHAEWIAAVGRGWRVDRVMIPAFLLVGLSLAVVGAAKGSLVAGVPGLLLCAFAGFEGFRHARKRSAWLQYCLSLPWSGKTMTIDVELGTLIQRHEFEGDPRFSKTGEVVDTPNGYLVKYRSARVDAPDAVSTTEASVYIPHVAIQPPRSRAKFRSLLA